jgi:hypothetical protein
MLTKLVTYLNDVLPSVCSQGLFDSFTLILARPSIKFLILYYWISLIIVDYLNFTLSDSKAIYQIDFLCSCLRKVFFSLFCIVGSTTRLYPWTSFV